MKLLRILRILSLLLLTYKFYMFSIYKAGLETWYIVTGVLGFNVLLEIIILIRKEK